jgi:hypothetical protein
VSIADRLAQFLAKKRKAESGKRRKRRRRKGEMPVTSGRGGEAMAVPLSQALSRMGRGSLWRFGMDREEVEVGLARTFPGR